METRQIYEARFAALGNIVLHATRKRRLAERILDARREARRKERGVLDGSGRHVVGVDVEDGDGDVAGMWRSGAGYCSNLARCCQSKLEKPLGTRGSERSKHRPISQSAARATMSSVRRELEMEVQRWL